MPERIYNFVMFSNVAETFIRLGAEFHRRGWVLGTSGNFSAVTSSNPLRLLITASSMDKGRLTADHFLEVEQNGNAVNGLSGKPSAETLLHIAVVCATGAASVLHTHSVWSTVLSDLHADEGGFFIEGYEMLKGLEGVTTHEHREWIPILENTQDMKALAAEASALLQKTAGVHGILIRQHGLYTWGKDPDAAARHVEILEFLFESVGRRRMIDPEPGIKRRK
jgi:methylthioribulose-1-phosphate dehydratase